MFDSGDWYRLFVAYSRAFFRWLFESEAKRKKLDVLNVTLVGYCLCLCVLWCFMPGWQYYAEAREGFHCSMKFGILTALSSGGEKGTKNSPENR